MWIFNKKEEEKKYLSDKDTQLEIARGILDGNFELCLRFEHNKNMNIDINVKIRNYLYDNYLISVDVESFSKPYGGLKTMWDNRYFVFSKSDGEKNYNFGGTYLYVLEHLFENNNKSRNNKLELYSELFSERTTNMLRTGFGFFSFEEFRLYINQRFEKHNKIVEERRSIKEKLEKFKNKIQGEK